MAHKIEISEDLTQPYAPPADAPLDVLREIAQSANDTAIALLEKPGKDVTDDDLARANWLSAAVDATQASIAVVEQKEQERQNTVDELKGKFKPADPQADADISGQSAAPADAGAEPAALPLAAAAVPSIGAIARSQSRPNVPTPSRGRVTLTAAADVPGFSNGQHLDLDPESPHLGEAFIARARGLTGQRGAGRVQSGFAKIVVDADPAVVASGSGATSVNVMEALKNATDQKRLPGGALTAAGWCAPSEVLYDPLNLSTAEGLISVPEISAPRGGLRWTTGPDFGTVYGNGTFSLTETQAIAGQTKPVFNIPCGTWTEARMNADGIYLTGDILTEHSWPEGISDYIVKGQIAWQHKVSGATIADMVAGSTVKDLSGPYEFGAIPTILGALELQAEDMKYRGRLSRNAPLEVILPFFARGIIRSDFAKRLDSDAGASISVTDAQIDDMFAVRGLNVQYVYDWQDAIVTSGSGSGAMGSETTPVSTWPQTFKALMYPAGTWARALAPVIELSTVYDSVLLTNNQYIALFIEQGRLTIKRGFDSRVVTLMSNPSGVTGGYASPTNPQAATPV